MHNCFPGFFDPQFAEVEFPALDQYPHPARHQEESKRARRHSLRRWSPPPPPCESTSAKAPQLNAQEVMQEHCGFQAGKEYPHGDNPYLKGPWQRPPVPSYAEVVQARSKPILPNVLQAPPVMEAKRSTGARSKEPQTLPRANPTIPVVRRTVREETTAPVPLNVHTSKLPENRQESTRPVPLPHHKRLTAGVIIRTPKSVEEVAKFKPEKIKPAKLNHGSEHPDREKRLAVHKAIKQATPSFATPSNKQIEQPTGTSTPRPSGPNTRSRTQAANAKMPSVSPIDRELLEGAHDEDNPHAKSLMLHNPIRDMSHVELETAKIQFFEAIEEMNRNLPANQVVRMPWKTPTLHMISTNESISNQTEEPVIHIGHSDSNKSKVPAPVPVSSTTTVSPGMANNSSLALP